MRLESEREGLKLLREIFAYDDLQPVIMVSAYGDTEAVLDSAESGALMFLNKAEFSATLLARMVEAVLQQARIKRYTASLQSRMPPTDSVSFAGKNPIIRRAMDLIIRASENPDCTVLISGEPGTGHDLAAHLIHDQSRTRSESAMVSFTALSTSSEDSEVRLFGSQRRDILQRTKGLIEEANGGVLFSDRVERLEAALRNSLFEVFRSRTLDLALPGIRIPIDVQFIAGTLPDSVSTVASELERCVGSQSLLEIHLPPLRERREDIPLLTAFYLQESRQAGKSAVRTVSPEALAILESYVWPGNLFELKSVVHFAAIQALIAGNNELLVEHLPETYQRATSREFDDQHWDYRYHLARSEVALADCAIDQHGDLNKKQIAQLLQYTDRFSFSRRIRAAFREFPRLAREFPRISGMFGSAQPLDQGS